MLNEARPNVYGFLYDKTGQTRQKCESSDYKNKQLTCLQSGAWVRAPPGSPN